MAVKQQVVLAPGFRWLGESAMEPLIEGAVESIAQGADVFLDLRAVTTVEPYALVTLGGLVRFLARNGVTPYLLLPEDAGALSTLHRAGFGPAVQSCIGNALRFEVGRREAEAAPVLVGLTAIRSAADVEAVRGLLAQARGAVREYLGFDDGEAALLEASLVEVAQNVWQHSEDWGLVCVARGLQPRTERRSVTVAVADLGIGIRSSLGQRYEIADWSDADAIAHAVRPGYSRCGEQRGIGLTQALAVARRFDGALVLRSGAARVHFADRRFHMGAPFPGVQLSLTVRQRRAGVGSTEGGSERVGLRPHSDSLAPSLRTPDTW
jgi:hypothetical protein